MTRIVRRRHETPRSCSSTREAEMYRPIAALVAVTLLVVLSSHVLDAQQPDAEPFAVDGIPAVSLPDPPVEYRTAEGQRIRVSVVTTGLTYPWGLAFLPDGSALVTERLGTLRVIREGGAGSEPAVWRACDAGPGRADLRADRGQLSWPRPGARRSRAPAHRTGRVSRPSRPTSTRAFAGLWQVRGETPRSGAGRYNRPTISDFGSGQGKRTS